MKKYPALADFERYDLRNLRTIPPAAQEAVTQAYRQGHLALSAEAVGNGSGHSIIGLLLNPNRSNPRNNDLKKLKQLHEMYRNRATDWPTEGLWPALRECLPHRHSRTLIVYFCSFS